ncbi:glycosyltransferase [Halobellus rubicundus]|uniref:Glycosyltransferase n=1 Tax=Halobellus rubicundus TaxID=2996466 RepID=A0ABD5MDT4_9EURY
MKEAISHQFTTQNMSQNKTSGDLGFLYIAMGNDYFREAEKSAETLQDEMQDFPITLITDKKECHSEHFDSINVVEDVSYSFGDVVNYIDQSPYDKTVYLDTDIYIQSDISEVFNMLEECDIAASVAENKWHMQHYDLEHPVKGVPEAFPWFNGGVIAFTKNKRTSRFFDLWRSEYRQDVQNGIIHNMPSLRCALYFSNIQLAPLPRRYNCLVRAANKTTGQIKVFHGRLEAFDALGASKEADIQIATKVLNNTTDPRIYIPLTDGSFEIIDETPVSIRTRYQSSNLIYRLIGSIQQHGIKNTLQTIYNKSLGYLNNFYN